jgi:CMP/dCMP kinase
MITAIDGPSASGKSTVARQTAEKLNFAYVDSGSLYRLITYKMLQENININSQRAVNGYITQLSLEYFYEAGAVYFTFNVGKPDDAIRSKKVQDNVSKVAGIKSVREWVGKHLRRLIELGDLVIEGRDIGTVVFPNADFKFYIDADVKERARRRYKQIISRNQDADFQEVLNGLMERDKRDATRKIAPLRVADDAYVLDTTKLGISQVVSIITNKISKGKSEGN